MLQPVKMMEEFLRLASENTRKNLETCGVLAGSLVRIGGGKGCLMLSNCKGSSLDSVTTGEQDSTAGRNHLPSSKERTESIVDVTGP